MTKYFIEYNKGKYFYKSQVLVGGFDNNFRIMSYEDLPNLQNHEYKTTDNDLMFNKSETILAGNYSVKFSNDIVSLYLKSEKGEVGKYSEFKIDNYNITFGYLKEMSKILEKLQYKKLNSSDLKSEYTMLILGFGLGGASLNFSKFNNIVRIDSIDLDPILFKLFKKITLSKNIKVSNKLRFIEGDAIEYLKYCVKIGKKYDLILDDLFYNYKKINYDTKLIYNCLNNGGMFFSNIHYNPYSYVKKLEDSNFRDVNKYYNNEYLIVGKK